MLFLLHLLSNFVRSSRLSDQINVLAASSVDETGD
jgi:hypothetical protein